MGSNTSALNTTTDAKCNGEYPYCKGLSDHVLQSSTSARRTCPLNAQAGCAEVGTSPAKRGPKRRDYRTTWRVAAVNTLVMPEVVGQLANPRAGPNLRVEAGGLVGLKVRCLCANAPYIGGRL